MEGHSPTHGQRTDYEGLIEVHTCCDGYLPDEGVSGTEIRDGESSALRMVCSCNPMVFETPEESDRSCQPLTEELLRV